MNKNLNAVSYSLAAVAGISLICGLAILSGEMMYARGQIRDDTTYAGGRVRDQEKKTYCRRGANKHLLTIWRFSIHRHDIKNGGQ